MNKFVRISLIVLLLLGLTGGAAYGWYAYSNRQKVQDLILTVTQPNGDREAMRDVRNQVKQLPAAYQQQFRQGMREQFTARMEQRMKDYLALDKAARVAYLDKQIAEEEKRRKEWEQRRKEREAAAAANRAAGNSSNSGQNDRGSGGNQNGGGNRGGGGGGGGIASRLDNSTPQMRAMRAEYVRDMNARRAQLGLPPMGGRGGWGGGGGGFGRR